MCETSTKKAIAKAFKDVMSRKCFDKITVQDITKECGLIRQTFYYHFEDRYDLTKWIFYQDVFLPCVEIFSEKKYYDAVLLMLKIMKNEDQFYKNVFSSSIDNSFKDYLYNVFETFIVTILKQKKESIDAGFYAHGFLGILTSWIRKGMQNSCEELASNLTSIFENAKLINIQKS